MARSLRFVRRCAALLLLVPTVAVMGCASDVDDAPQVSGPGVDTGSPDASRPDTGGNDNDEDGDGFDSILSGGTDCDDRDPAVNPHAEEVCGDGVDNDCDGYLICDGGTLDADADDHGSIESGGTDCDDADPDVNGLAEEVCGDGIDNDCDGFIICDGGTLDEDGDGYASEASGGTDCDDSDPLANPSLIAACPCGGGEYRGTDGACTQTDPGYYSPDGDPEQHPSGAGYVAAAGAAEATPSPAGGYYAPAAANAEALECDPGNFTDTEGDEGASRCIECQPGRACPGDGRALTCAAGTYQPGEGAQGCFPCPTGSTTAGPGALLRSQCYQTYGTPEILHDCSAQGCPAGSEQPCLSSGNGAYSIDGQANLAQLCLELTGGSYRGHEQSTGNSYCVDYQAPNWVFLSEGNFTEATSVTCYHDE